MNPICRLSCMNGELTGDFASLGTTGTNASGFWDAQSLFRAAVLTCTPRLTTSQPEYCRESGLVQDYFQAPSDICSSFGEFNLATVGVNISPLPQYTPQSPANPGF